MKKPKKAPRPGTPVEPPPPTPAQIRQRCLEIQATWDEATRQQRANARPWEFPERRLDTRRR